MKISKIIIILLWVIFTLNNSFAQKFDNPKSFEQWKIEFTARALKQGITQTTLDRAFVGKTRNAKVIFYDRRQPEFTSTFQQYIRGALSETRIMRAKVNYKKNIDLLVNVYNKYSVQPRFLIAFWGLETNFGTNIGNLDVIRSLATLSHDLRRSGFFEKELILALKIIQDGHAQSSNFKGSWAGAFGQTQFMPSTFASYSVDGDGDGLKNLWESKSDIFSSSANFLNKVGWNGKQSWGVRVSVLPANFNWQLSGHKTRKTLGQWEKLGIRTADGKSLLANSNYMGLASLLLPAGSKGPKFLVFNNFRKILNWNRSDNYALAVGLLADEIAGKQYKSLTTASGGRALNRDDYMKIQFFLKQQGFYHNGVDGVFGSKSKNALKKYQHSEGMIADGFADEKILKHIKERRNR